MHWWYLICSNCLGLGIVITIKTLRHYKISPKAYAYYTYYTAFFIIKAMDKQNPL